MRFVVVWWLWCGDFGFMVDGYRPVTCCVLILLCCLCVLVCWVLVCLYCWRVVCVILFSVYGV